MIPPTLAAFRALMGRVEGFVVDALNSGYYYNGDGSVESDADAIRALTTATPEQLLGIVGRVQCLDTAGTVSVQIGDYIVTPREDAGGKEGVT